MTNNHSTPSENISKYEQMVADQPQNPASRSDISQDPDYKLMLAESQQAHWDECAQLISTLNERYPGNSKLAECKKDFELQYGIINDLRLSSKEYNRKKFLGILKNLTIIVGLLIGAFLIIWYGSKAYLNIYQEKQRLDNANQINELSQQVEVLLSSDQPEKAQELIENMKGIDPTSPKIIELTQKTEELIEINNLYLGAVDMLKNGRNSDALSILMKIESDYPGYKDVPHLIDSANTEMKIAQALSSGIEAYNAGKWQEAMDAFEQVLALDPMNSDSNLKEMLTNSYLNLAVQMITDPIQTVDSVNQAYIYMGKASSLNPKDTSLKAQVEKMGFYKSGFSDYIGMRWRSAIQQLTALGAMDEGYANGFARQILFEAHMVQGNQFYSAGAYANAINDFESAKTLALGKDNLLNFYLAEINLGRAQGQLKQYEDASAAYMNAIQSINYEQRGTASATFISDLSDAVALSKDGQFENSYNSFSETLAGDNNFFEIKMINARQGNCLALIAAHYQSSVQAILQQNKLPQQTIISTDQTLSIPVIP
jgi:tetratricopeptide (TPR) repeat protein